MSGISAVSFFRTQFFFCFFFFLFAAEKHLKEENSKIETLCEALNREPDRLRWVFIIVRKYWRSQEIIREKFSMFLVAPAAEELKRPAAGAWRGMARTGFGGWNEDVRMTISVTHLDI